MGGIDGDGLAVSKLQRQREPGDRLGADTRWVDAINGYIEGGGAKCSSRLQARGCPGARHGLGDDQASGLEAVGDPHQWDGR